MLDLLVDVFFLRFGDDHPDSGDELSATDAVYMSDVQLPGVQQDDRLRASSKMILITLSCSVSVGVSYRKSPLHGATP